MESSIAVFLKRQAACELLPTESSVKKAPLQASAFSRCCCCKLVATLETHWLHFTPADSLLRPQSGASQRSLQDAPIFRLLLKVAVKGTHQCDFLNFCGALVPQRCFIPPWVERTRSGNGVGDRHAAQLRRYVKHHAINVRTLLERCNFKHDVFVST